MVFAPRLPLPEIDHYSLLGLPRNANAEEVKAAYRRQARECHPDKNTDDNATERFKEVVKAYEVLASPRKRREYDVRCDIFAFRSGRSKMGRSMSTPLYTQQQQQQQQPPQRAAPPAGREEKGGSQGACSFFFGSARKPSAGSPHSMNAGKAAPRPPPPPPPQQQQQAYGDEWRRAMSNDAYRELHEARQTRLHNLQKRRDLKVPPAAAASPKPAPANPQTRPSPASPATPVAPPAAEATHPREPAAADAGAEPAPYEPGPPQDPRRAFGMHPGIPCPPAKLDKSAAARPPPKWPKADPTEPPPQPAGARARSHTSPKPKPGDSNPPPACAPGSGPPQNGSRRSHTIPERPGDRLGHPKQGSPAEPPNQERRGPSAAREANNSSRRSHTIPERPGDRPAGIGHPKQGSTAEPANQERRGPCAPREANNSSRRSHTIPERPGDRPAGIGHPKQGGAAEPAGQERRGPCATREANKSRRSQKRPVRPADGGAALPEARLPPGADRPSSPQAALAGKGAAAGHHYHHQQQQQQQQQQQKQGGGSKATRPVPAVSEARLPPGADRPSSPQAGLAGKGAAVGHHYHHHHHQQHQHQQQQRQRQSGGSKATRPVPAVPEVRLPPGAERPSSPQAGLAGKGAAVGHHYHHHHQQHQHQQQQQQRQSGGSKATRPVPVVPRASPSGAGARSVYAPLSAFVADGAKHDEREAAASPAASKPRVSPSVAGVRSVYAPLAACVTNGAKQDERESPCSNPGSSSKSAAASPIITTATSNPRVFPSVPARSVHAPPSACVVDSAKRDDREPPCSNGSTSSSSSAAASPLIPPAAPKPLASTSAPAARTPADGAKHDVRPPAKCNSSSSSSSNSSGGASSPIVPPAGSPPSPLAPSTRTLPPTNHERDPPAHPQSNPKGAASPIVPLPAFAEADAGGILHPVAGAAVGLSSAAPAPTSAETANQSVGVEAVAGSWTEGLPVAREADERPGPLEAGVGAVAESAPCLRPPASVAGSATAVANGMQVPTRKMDAYARGVSHGTGGAAAAPVPYQAHRRATLGDSRTAASEAVAVSDRFQREAAYGKCRAADAAEAAAPEPATPPKEPTADLPPASAAQEDQPDEDLEAGWTLRSTFHSPGPALASTQPCPEAASPCLKPCLAGASARQQRVPALLKQKHRPAIDLAKSYPAAKPGPPDAARKDEGAPIVYRADAARKRAAARASAVMQTGSPAGGARRKSAAPAAPQAVVQFKFLDKQLPKLPTSSDRSVSNTSLGKSYRATWRSFTSSVASPSRV
ncbi:Chaperone protein DnaJ 2 [Diplonema papillatum]|nr:Chaperone protein DnaJ 2 [Diplonema papillatum]